MGGSWCLTATSGPAKGNSWLLGKKPLTIGRSHQCHVSIHDSAVSRLHCELALRDHRVVLKDLGSANATLLNGRPVQEAKLHAGDEITIGPAVFFVSRMQALSTDTDPDVPGASATSARGPIIDVDASPIERPKRND